MRFIPNHSCLEIHNSLPLKRFQKIADVFTNLCWVPAAVRFRKRGHDLLNRALPVAKLQDVLPCPLNSNHSFGKEHDSFLTLIAPPAT